MDNSIANSALTVAKFGGTSVADFTAMSRSAKIVIANPDTKIVLISACSGVTNILVELANGVSDASTRQQRLQQLTQTHQDVLDQLKQPSSIQDAIYSLLDSVATLAEQAAVATSAQLTDQIVSHGELLSTYLFTQILVEQNAPADV